MAGFTFKLTAPDHDEYAALAEISGGHGGPYLPWAQILDPCGRWVESFRYPSPAATIARAAGLCREYDKSLSR